MSAVTVKLRHAGPEAWALTGQRLAKSAGGGKPMAAPSECVGDGGINLAVPRRGHVLTTVVETYGKPIREAVAALSGLLEKSWSSARNLPTGARPGAEHSRPEAEMAAWTIVSMWVVGVAVKAFPPTASLADAERWFSGSEQLLKLTPALGIDEAEAALQSKADALAYSQLLPYILDPHGPGSRLSVRRDPATQSVRKRKRDEGVFYTPADIAEYMASACIAEFKKVTLPTVFDPACGTGVFLRAALRELSRRYPDLHPLALASKCLFGTDIDPWPLDAAAFVLLADCWNDELREGTFPIEVWRKLRKNLACVDTLRIDPAGLQTHRDAARIPISILFPALKNGPGIVLGNPPYANLGNRTDMTALGCVFGSLGVKPEPGAEIYLAFVEQMIRLADKENCAGALVLPLSLACNVGAQFSKARDVIFETRGRWRFAFFDREPHALFGEDVKTRNALVLWSRSSSDTKPALETGPLRKWRGNSRAAMFRGIRFTAVDTNIHAGIPKIDGPLQAAALKALDMRWGRLEQVAQSIAQIDLAEVPDADDRTVFVGATAYNFLNVFLRPPKDLLDKRGSLSKHPLHAVRCVSRQDALAVFAILSSHLSYWWWHTHGDGFHVSRRFIAALPFGNEDLGPETTNALAVHGAELWSAIKEMPIISTNRGSTSLGYSPNGYDDLRRRVDETLAVVAGLESSFVDELQQFTAHTVAATLPAGKVAAIEENETE